MSIDASTIRQESGTALPPQRLRVVGASVEGNWVGILSPHPLATRFLCDLVNRTMRIRQIISSVRPIDLEKDTNIESPCAVVLDTMFAGRGPVECIIRKVMTKFPECRLIGLTSSRDEDVVLTLCLGFDAVVQSTDNLGFDLACAITAVLSGSIWAPRSAIRKYVEHVQSTLEARCAHDQLLTARESQILEYVLFGRSNKEIAVNLKIAERTVKFHISNILSKMEVTGRRKLIENIGSKCEVR